LIHRCAADLAVDEITLSVSHRKFERHPVGVVTLSGLAPTASTGLAKCEGLIKVWPNIGATVTHAWHMNSGSILDSLISSGQRSPLTAVP
jgi:hypothetical protein